MNRFGLPALAALLVAITSAGTFAQKMPDKWDQTCLDDAGKRYITCMAASGTSQTAKQTCQKTMDDEKKLCKKK